MSKRFQAGRWVCRVSLRYGFHVSLTTHGRAHTRRRAHALAIEHEPIDTGNRTGAPASLHSPVRCLGEEDSSILLQTEGGHSKRNPECTTPTLLLMKLALRQLSQLADRKRKGRHRAPNSRGDGGPYRSWGHERFLPQTLSPFTTSILSKFYYPKQGGTRASTTNHRHYRIQLDRDSKDLTQLVPPACPHMSETSAAFSGCKGRQGH